MSHIHYTRQVDTVRSRRLSSFFPADSIGSFSAFCGSAAQRYAVAMQAINQARGRMGIVVLHDAPDFDMYIHNSSSQRQGINYVNTRVYDPLYGLDSESIQNIIIPTPKSDIHNPEITSLRNALLIYLEILEHQFRLNPQPFGRYPYNLNMLLSLTEMPIATLSDNVLRHLPQGIASRAIDILDVSNMQKRIYSYVNTFAAVMEKYLWTRGSFATHTTLSVIQSVTNRQLISIRIPESRSDLLSYFARELAVLYNQNTPFMVVSVGLELKNCPELRALFLGDHIQKNYYTGIVADSFASVSDEPSDVASVISQSNNMFVFACSSADQANPFSSQFGSYYRHETDYTRSRERQPFHIFSSISRGITSHYIEEQNIRPSDLIDNYNGALLCGRDYTLPVLIRNLTLEGGNHHGLLLPRL